MTDAGPYFQPCPVAARTPEATTTNARLAMQQLASRSTPYPAAQTSTQASTRPRATGAGPQATDTTSNATPPTTVRDGPAANTGEANASPLPTTVDQLGAALAALPQTHRLGQSTAAAPDTGRHRALATDSATMQLPPPRALALPAHTTRDYPNLTQALERLGGTIMECGATSLSAESPVACSQCFYLALAATVAAHQANHATLAAELRARIEGAVRAARPQW